MECKIKPYDGTEKRIAMIHASDDDAIVFPFIERLYKNGLRVWHDSDIRKVMVEYKRNWKEQQALCNAYLVFLSKNATKSHVFRERMTSAVESGKPIIVINTLDQDSLSPGMKLQIERAIIVIQSNYIPREKLAEEIAELQALKDYAGKPDSGFIASAYPKGQAAQERSAPLRPERSIPPSDRTMLELNGVQKPAAPGSNTESGMPDPVPMNTNKPETISQITDSSKSLEETICLSETDLPSSADSDATVVPQKAELPVIISLSSGERRKGILGESVVGRTKKIQGAAADISFTDECRLFSGKHFSILFIDQVCMLICKHPNGMNVNGQEMQEGDRFTVDSEALIQIPSNNTLMHIEKDEIRPTYLLVARGDRAKELWDAEAIAFLQSKETGEIRCFTDQFSFGRGNAWKTGVMASRNISRNHGTIIFNSGKYCFQDHSKNGTLINGTKINKESLELNNNDIISVPGDDQNEEKYLFHGCFFEKG